MVRRRERQNSMMFVPADTFDVVPGRSLVAAITLVHLHWPAAFGDLRVLFGDFFETISKCIM